MQISIYTAPACWASYLVNGDASGIAPNEKSHADAFLARESVRVLDVKRDADGDPNDPYFTWSFGCYDPLATVEGGTVQDYVCEVL